MNYALVGGIIAVALLILYDLITKNVSYRYGHIHKDEHPIAYWSLMLSHFIVLGFLIVVLLKYT